METPRGNLSLVQVSPATSRPDDGDGVVENKHHQGGGQPPEAGTERAPTLSSFAHVFPAVIHSSDASTAGNTAHDESDARDLHSRRGGDSSAVKAEIVINSSYASTADGNSARSSTHEDRDASDLQSREGDGVNSAVKAKAEVGVAIGGVGGAEGRETRSIDRDDPSAVESGLRKNDDASRRRAAREAEAQLTRFRKACDLCTKRKRKCNGEQPCYYCQGGPMNCCIYSLRRKSGRKKPAGHPVDVGTQLNVPANTARDMAQGRVELGSCGGGSCSAAVAKSTGVVGEDNAAGGFFVPSGALWIAEQRKPSRSAGLEVTLALEEAECRLKKVQEEVRRVRQLLATVDVKLCERRENDYSGGFELFNERARSGGCADYLRSLEGRLSRALNALMESPEETGDRRD